MTRLVLMDISFDADADVDTIARWVGEHRCAVVRNALLEPMVERLLEGHASVWPRR